MKNLLFIDKLLYAFTGIIALLSLFFGFTNATYFDQVFAQEDGFIEYATFFFLLLICILQFSRLKRWKSNTSLWGLAVLFMGLLFFFGAGEEISWGQRIFNIESGEFFQDNNLQKETNLHNLEVNGVKLNKLIFSQILTGIMVVYLLIFPVLFQKVNWINSLSNKLAIPVPKTHQIIAFLASTLVIVVLPNLSRKWEVYELFFATLFFLIFLNPVNKKEAQGV